MVIANWEKKMQKQDVKNSEREASIQRVMQQLLMRANLTANGLATKLNLPTPTVHRLLIGDVQDPRLSTMLLIADYFEITLEQLIGRHSLNKKSSLKHQKKTNTRKQKS